MGWVFVGIIFFDILWVLWVSPFILRKISYNHGLPGMAKYFRLETWLLSFTAVAAAIVGIIICQDDLYKVIKYFN